MFKTYLSILILFCLRKINGERTIYSIFHLLKGKKSSQTIQDSHLFHLTSLFQTFPSLSRHYFEKEVSTLENNQLIICVEGEKFRLTEKGETLLAEEMEKFPLPPHLNGWTFHSLQDEFWKRFSLLVQVSSNFINYESTYIPIHSDSKISEWLKTALRKLHLNREKLANQLLSEITSCFANEKGINPNVIVLRLTGYKQIGLTPKQAGEHLGMDPAYFQLEFLNIIHFLIHKISKYKTQYPILFHLLSDFQNRIVLTNSSSITYIYLKKGYSIDEIATIRNLKVSTIEDHVVEIVLNEPSFPLEPYVSLENQDLIKKSMIKLATKQLKTIRQDIHEKVSYFQIRLVLAKLGD
ncbi:helix-turn-helix domain-containing protein [Bacillus sp. CGMCC 1.16607]|uniref:helix-turn-helix domain-containing protein n=1 Tax=Bacillus sp. CGMCC 1.16607 TaxID=3351842 RepID=UPI00366CAF23